MSDSPLEHEPRDLGEFSVSEDVRGALARLRHRSGVTARPEIDADRVREVEIGVVFRFPNDLLAVWAAGVPVLQDRYQLSLNKVVAHGGTLRDRGARGDLIGLGRIDPHCHICLEKNTHRDAAVTVTLYDDTDRSLRSIGLARWLEEIADELPAAGGEPPEFRPQLTRVLPGGSDGARVRHKVFGEGRV